MGKAYDSVPVIESNRNNESIKYRGNVIKLVN